MKKTFALVVLLAAVAPPAVTNANASPRRSAQDEAETAANKNSAVLVRRLTSRDPAERQRAAEELAELRATEHLRLVEGYRLQEKNARARVALDWALYRMGRKESLFDLVRALDTSRSDQAQVYLYRLGDPAPLYVFLDSTRGATQVKLLQVLADIGDAATLEHVAPLTRSLDPKVADAARQAADEISKRTGQPADTQTTQPPADGSVPGPLK